MMMMMMMQLNLRKSCMMRLVVINKPRLLIMMKVNCIRMQETRMAMDRARASVPGHCMITRLVSTSHIGCLTL